MIGFVSTGPVLHKFVRLKAKRRYAHPTKDEALQSFIERKQRQIEIFEAKLVRVKKARQMAVEAKVLSGKAPKNAPDAFTRELCRDLEAEIAAQLGSSSKTNEDENEADRVPRVL